MSSGVPTTDIKSRRELELNELREMGLAKNQRGKYKSTGTFLTPEEAMAYIQESHAKKRARARAPEPPTNLSSAEINDWYSQQRKRDVEERRRKEEAERFLRGYRYKSQEGSNYTGVIGGSSSAASASAVEIVTASSTVHEHSNDNHEIILNSDTLEEEEEEQLCEKSVNIDHDIDDHSTMALDESVIPDENIEHTESGVFLETNMKSEQKIEEETNNDSNDDDNDYDKEDNTTTKDLQSEEEKQLDLQGDDDDDDDDTMDNNNSVLLQDQHEHESGNVENVPIPIDNDAQGDIVETQEKTSQLVEQEDKKIELTSDTVESSEQNDAESNDDHIDGGDITPKENVSDSTNDNKKDEDGSVEEEEKSQNDDADVTDNSQIMIDDESKMNDEETDKDSGSNKEDTKLDDDDTKLDDGEEQENDENNQKEEIISSEIDNNTTKIDEQDSNTMDGGEEHDEKEEVLANEPTSKDSVESKQVEVVVVDEDDDIQEEIESGGHDKDLEEIIEDDEISPAVLQHEESMDNDQVIRWNNWIRKDNTTNHPAEPGRYHLYLSHASPDAHQVQMVLTLKGLDDDDIIGVTYVHPTWQFTNKDVDDHRGWVFGSKDGAPITPTNGFGGSFPSSYGASDPNYNSNSVRDLYNRAGDKVGPFTVPLLWDMVRDTIVSNESRDIMHMLNSEFNEHAKFPNVDLYPKESQKEIDAINEWVIPTMNGGVNRCGDALSQDDYNCAIDEFTESFDRIAFILSKQSFLVGDQFSEADIHLFVILLRLDEVYSVLFRINTRSVISSPTILNYMRRIYQMKGVAETCNMEMIKISFFTSYLELNKYSIIPRGENIKALLEEEPHD